MSNLRQEVGDSLYLVVREDGRFVVREKIVWGAKDTETEWGDRGYMVLVDPDDEYETHPDSAMMFRHGEDLTKFAGAFSSFQDAENVCAYLNS